MVNNYVIVFSGQRVRDSLECMDRYWSPSLFQFSKLHARDRFITIISEYLLLLLLFIVCFCGVVVVLLLCFFVFFNSGVGVGVGGGWGG